ncbi:alanine:cation symporter family protein [Paenibacillus xylanexedens]|uniref:alanine:cation symporter family protein n=1 Tax=Paenibacillus xylanexedens TaxID=528191 RepID=UPI0021B1C7F0|nr:alanine:cation symporter family protein [Paenibacillus xylanexedens]
MGIEEVGGGRVGGGVMKGVKGGLLWNEGGMGSGGNGGGSADTSDRVKEGVIEAFGVVRERVMMCRSSGMIILL